MRKMTRRFLGRVLAMVMIISQFAGAGTTTAAAEETTEYVFNAEVSATSVKVGETITLTSKVLYGEEEITDLSATEYTIWWSVNGDNWSNATFGYGENTDGKALEATASFGVAGTYYLVGKLQDGNWNTLKEVYFTVEVAENSEELKLEVLDSTFEGDLWNDGIWTVVPASWDNTDFTYFTYADDQYMKPGENQGTTAFKFWTQSAQEITVLQTVDIPAGTYKVASDFMGEKGSVQVVFGGQQGAAGTLNGYNTWVYTEDTFTVAEDMKAAIIGFKIIAEAGGYGYIDSISVTEVNPSVEDEEDEEVKDEETVTYAVEVSVDSTTVKAGDTVALVATVTKNGAPITDLAAEGLFLWWWTDSWNDHSDGLSDTTYSNYDNNSGNSLVADVTVPSVGTYYIAAELQKADGTKITTAFSTITTTDPNAFSASDANYTVVVTVDNLAPEAGDTVAMTAKVTKADGTEVTDLATEGVSLWWWTDSWNDHADGLSDTTYSNWDDNSGNSLTADVTLPSVGTYYIVGQLEYNGTKLPVVIPMTTTEPEETEVDTTISGEITVEKIKKLPEDFIMGMDISSVMSLFASGVTYKDFEGNTINNITDFCKFLATNGITHIRVRVWNDPFDAGGNGYGGGNCDVATAAEIANGCRAAGLKMLIDFHCSDLWADPGKQQAPKAWANYSVAEKATAVEEFIGNALKTIDPNHETVDMVQVGNETTGGFVGVYNTADMCTLFSAGAKAVHEYNDAVKVVIHVTNPEKGNVTKWAANLNTYAVDYDVLATSYYPYWHGTLANLESELKTVKTTYGKDVMVAETSYAYTLEDSDGHSNTVRVGNNDSSTSYPFTVQGQANSIRDVMETVNNAGGLGVFYWESAWLTVGDIRGLEGNALEAQIEANKAIWEKYGSGWASSYAGEYDAKDAGVWYGGSAVDNEAMFYPDGTPTAALYVWNYVKTGAVSKNVSVEAIANPETTVNAGATLALPATVTVSYNSGDVEESVAWNTAEVEAIDTAVPGTYKVNGTVMFSKEINQGTYKDQTTAAVVYTVVVKPINLFTDAKDAGFESGTNYTIEGNGIKSIPSNEDVYAGNGCLHWYSASATTGVVTYNKVLTVEAGKYSLSAMTAGYAGEKVTLQILNVEKEVLFAGDAAVTTGWNLWDAAEVTFEVKETTDIMLRVVVEIQDGGWGSVDELYMYKVAEASKPAVKPSTPSVTPNDEEESSEEETVVVAVPEVKLDLTLDVKPEETEKHVMEEVVEKDGKNIRVLLSVEMDGVEVAGEAHVIPAGVDFEIKHVEKDAKEYKKAESAVQEQIKVAETFTVFEMNLVSEEGVQIRALDDFIKVTVPMPENLVVGEAQRLVVYRMEEDGSLTKCETIVENGMVIFTTNHFSTYVFVVEGNEAVSAPANDVVEKEETGNVQEEIVAIVDAGGDIPMWPVLMAIVVFLAFVGLYVYAKQRKMIK